MSRKRGRIVLVGVVGLDMRRDDFYKKNCPFRFLVAMVQGVMMRSMKIKVMIILCHTLGGLKKKF